MELVKLIKSGSNKILARNNTTGIKRTGDGVRVYIKLDNYQLLMTSGEARELANRLIDRVIDCSDF